MRRARRWFVAAALAAAVTAASTVTLTETAAAESNGGVRVMPLGDSITEGTQVPGGYRIGLWQRLAVAGYRTDFVGSQFNGPAALGGTNQRWTVNANGTISNAQSGLCLDVTGNVTANGTTVALWTCTAAANQRWTRR